MIQALRLRRGAVILALLALLIGGVAADCSDNNSGGMWQGGSDSEPGWR